MDALVLDFEGTISPVSTVEGTLDGEPGGTFYGDVRPALENWRRDGRTVHIFSATSRADQYGWFEQAHGGSMTHLVDDFFDLESAGPKKETSSYVAIGEKIGATPACTLFLSDSSAEINAARRAGWAAVLVARPMSLEVHPGGPDPTTGLAVVSSLGEVLPRVLDLAPLAARSA